MKLFVRPAGALVLIAGLSACDVPTGIPRWETTWITPGEGTTVSVAELLPAGIAITPDSSAFVLGFDPVDTAWQLSEFCPACPPIAATVPKPAFSGTVSTQMPLPASVQSVVVAGGDVDIALTNGFDFDPIRPGATADSGSLTITVTSGGATVATFVIDGADRAFPPGTTINETLAFQPSTITDALTFEFTVDSPAGDPTTVDPADELSASIQSTGVLVSEATVAASSLPIEGAEMELDLADVEEGDRFKEGTIFLEIQNPFSLTGQLTMTVDPAGPAGPFVKPVALVAGESEASVTFVEAEIQQMIGAVNTITIDGVVSAVGGGVTVRPDMVIGVETRLRVTVEVGGDPDDDSGF